MKEAPWTSTFWDLANCLREREVLCDLRLSAPTVDGDMKTFAVHKLLLSLASKWFMAKMVQENLKEEYVFDKISALGLQGVVKFIYGQDINGSQGDYREYLKAAEELKVLHAQKMFRLALKKTRAFGFRASKQSSQSLNNDETERAEDEFVDDIDNHGDSDYNPEDDGDSDHEDISATDKEIISQFAPFEPGPGRKIRKVKRVSKDEPPIHVCTLCNVEFEKKHRLIKHQKVAHNIGKEYKCEYCEKTFQFKTQYNYHKLSHTNEKPYLCNICGKGFAMPSTLKLHMEIHKPESEKKFSCPHCSKKFAQKGNMDRHILGRHTKDKIFTCDVCGKSFHWHKSLIDHRSRHDGPRPKLFQCRDCDYAFDTKYKLERHSVVHAGIKPFICDWCGQRFTQAGSMNKHKKDSCKMKPGLAVPVHAAVAPAHAVIAPPQAHAAVAPQQCAIAPPQGTPHLLLL